MEVIQLETKIGLPTLQIERNGKKTYIHSKYDPIKEALQVLESHKPQIERHQHILFYGVGLGYHIRAFIEHYPEKLLSTYEPIKEIAKICATSTPQTMLDQSKIRHIFIQEEPMDLEKHLYTLSNHLRQNVLLIILPSYERFLKDEILQFIERFKQVAKQTNQNVIAYDAFSKRWMINTLKNLPSTFENPNFLLEHANTFKDKAVILVAAGPSLDEEIENLRHIKNHGLAYVFAVGSANKALISQGIYPDAILTYDPQSHNHKVFQSVIDQRITTIPLIYGTSVGYETINRYPGPKFHFVTSQDTVTQNFHSKQLPVINDAYSIAIVTLEILYFLEVSKIILVGQNFAFKDELFYSKEIKRYDNMKLELADSSVQQQDLIYSYYVKDVDGQNVLTNVKFDSMRKLMEEYILQNTRIPVFNTTRGGANIEGAPYIPLIQIIEKHLNEQIILKEWFTKGEKQPFTKKSKDALRTLKKSIDSYREDDKALIQHFREHENNGEQLSNKHLLRLFEKNDKLVRKITKNLIYQVIIQPTIRNHFEKLQSEAELLRKKDSTNEKYMNVIKLFSTYFDTCREVYREIIPVLKSVIFPKLTNYNSEQIVDNNKIYLEGNWRKKVHFIQDIEDAPRIVYSSAQETSDKHAKVSFRFQGTTLRLYGTNHSEILLELKVTVDNNVYYCKVNESIVEKQYGSFMRQQFFEIEKLEDCIHHITIEIISSSPHVIFQNLELDKGKNIFHINEVFNFEDLTIGKCIRCYTRDDLKGDQLEVFFTDKQDMSILLNELRQFYITKVYINHNNEEKFICNDNIGANNIMFKKDSLEDQIKLNKVPNMNSDDEVFGRAKCSSSYKNEQLTWSAYKAFNNVSNNHFNAWATEKGITAGWIEFEFAKKENINIYTLVSQGFSTYFNSAKRMPSIWIFEAFDEVDGWITLDKQKNVNDYITGIKKVFTFENNKSYKRYRLNVQDNNGDPHFLSIGKIELL